MKENLEKYINILKSQAAYDGVTPYFGTSDFKNLKEIKKTFINSKGCEIAYFSFSKEISKDKTIVFLPGIGIGHLSYMREIDTITNYGYEVITLDYMGTGESKGDTLSSLNTPTLDSYELIKILNRNNIALIGHSLGGYAGLNLSNLLNNVKKYVILSGFLSIERLGNTLGTDLTDDDILSYENNNLEREIDNISNLTTTDKDMLLIQSTDDMFVPYKDNLKYVEDNIKNKHVKCIHVSNKYHNPNYMEDAVKYMIKSFTDYQKLVQNGNLDTKEKQREYMDSLSILKMTEQDMDIWNEIFNFIEK